MWTIWIFIAIFKSSFAEIPRASCSVRSPSLNQCLTEFAQKYIPIVAKDGILELGVSPLDPFEIPNLAFDFNSNKLRGTVEFRQGLLKGLKYAKVLNLNVNLNDPKVAWMELDGFAEKLLLEGVYKGNTRLAGMDVRGEGVIKVLLEGVNVKVRGLADVLPADATSRNYLRVREVDVTPTFANMKFKIDGLMPDNPEVADTAVRILNQQWREFYADLLPFLKPNINAIVVQAANQVVKGIPIQNVIPDYRS